jgi:hypothetical protein
MATDTDMFAAIHDASRQVRADVTANVARAYQIRVNARLHRLRAAQLRAQAQQLARMQLSGATFGGKTGLDWVRSEYGSSTQRSDAAT